MERISNFAAPLLLTSSLPFLTAAMFLNPLLTKAAKNWRFSTFRFVASPSSHGSAFVVCKLSTISTLCQPACLNRYSDPHINRRYAATALVSSEYVLKKGANRRSFLYHSERNVHALRGGNNINDSGNVVDGVESGPISSHTNGVGGNSEAEILTLFNSLRQRLEGDGADSTAGMRREVHLLDPSI